MGAKSDILDLLKSLPDDDPLFTAIDAMSIGARIPYIPGSPKPEFPPAVEPRWNKDERINPRSIIEERDNYIKYNQRHYNYYGRNWGGFRDAMKLVMEQAEQFGIDLKGYAPETFGLSDIKSVDSIMETAGEQLDDLAERLERSQEIALSHLPTVKKKSWAMVLRKAADLQRKCSSKVRARAGSAKRSAKERSIDEAWEYTHALRYMLYVMRSNLMSADGSETFVDTPIHIVKMALHIGIARAHTVSHGIKGVLIMIAPRHGKSVLASCDRALEMRQNPWKSCGIVHNKKQIAQDRQAFVTRHFDPDDQVGRRAMALFPDLHKHKKKTTLTKLLLQRKNGDIPCRHEEGNLQPFGVHEGAQGITLHEIQFDDPTDEKEATEVGTRERTNSAMSKTWMARLTGKAAFFVYICTSWHPSDFANTLRKLFGEGGIKIALYMQACGGPEDIPEFAPLWPEAGFDSEFLRGAYNRLGAADYACIYQNNADSEASRRVHRLHFYDNKVLRAWNRGELKDENWQRFFAEAKYIISIDPSGTDNRKSNLAGICYAAFGMLRDSTAAGQVFERPKVVMLRYWSMPSSQHKISDLVSEFYHEDSRQVDKILVESGSGWHATADDLVSRKNIPSTKVIKRAPGVGTKVARLMKYAIHLENGDVLFPGTWSKDEHGAEVLTIDSQWEPFGVQLLRAGSEKHDNLLDVMRQLLGELSFEIYKMKGGNVEGTPGGPQRSHEWQRQDRWYRDRIEKSKPKQSQRGDSVRFLARKVAGSWTS